MYYQCPECGYKQKSEAVDRIECHRCGKSYDRKKAKKVDKKPDEEKGLDFFKYEMED
ncbi:MAG: hypothetical protein MUP63_01800 [Candidatus Nanohaloarchaeota archaeon QJJ-7]|nr:hypothetical protein [Candidatus Nanohaloarchaeota archaeon QJJ-7]